MNFEHIQWNEVFCRMYGLVMIEFKTMSGHLSNINEILVRNRMLERSKNFTLHINLHHESNFLSKDLSQHCRDPHKTPCKSTNFLLWQQEHIFLKEKINLFWLWLIWRCYNHQSNQSHNKCVFNKKKLHFFKRINLALVLCGALWRKWVKNGF